MASWPVSASNLLRDSDPITSEKKWPGLYSIKGARHRGKVLVLGGAFTR